jgi:carbonic anhydrase
MCAACDLQLLSRRKLMLGAGASVAAGLLPGTALAQDHSQASPMSPEAALEALMQGNARHAAKSPEHREDFEHRADRAEAQHPFAAILACSDSRVAPERVFDQGPGDIFAVRLAGNIVNDDGLASLEYAVKFLGTPLVMVLGHTNCGAVTAAVNVVTRRAALPGHLPKLIAAIEPAVIAAHGRHPSDLVAASIEENVKLSVKRLRADEPIVTEALVAKELIAVGGVYDLASGTVKLL